MEIDHGQPTTYELKQMIPDAPHLVLHNNGQAAMCPFNPLQPVVEDGQQTGWGRVPCNTGCPLSTLTICSEQEKKEATSKMGLSPDEGKDIQLFTLSCGGTQVRRYVKTVLYSPIAQPGHGGLCLPN